MTNKALKKVNQKQMSLFDGIQNEPIQFLPKDGEVVYYENIFLKEQGIRFFNNLMQDVEWEHDELFMFGKKIITKRKVAWYGDEPFDYTYSNATKTAKPWNNDLKKIKLIVEEFSGETFNSCLLNLYHNGSEGMAWHSDDEKELKKNGTIASVSIGTVRKFMFKHKETKETASIVLASGSLLLMKGECQTHWLHRLPPTKKVSEPRINLTFRTIVKY